MPRKTLVSLADLFALAERSAKYQENPSDASITSALKRMGYSSSETKFIRKYYGAIHYAFTHRVGALDFLSGVSGQALGAVPEELVDEVKAALQQALSLGLLGSLGVIEDLNVADGTLVASKQGKSRTYRLGKLLKKAGATSTLLRKFETREVQLNWQITADPMEVASMSYGRSWVSCMRPGHEYERGPISDVLAGSALVLFYRPGADKPCGRIVLRPSAVPEEGKPVIVLACRGYGTVAALSEEALEDAILAQTGLEVVVEQRKLFDEDGPYRGVYDDCRRTEVPVDPDDVPELTEALRETWTEFVDLPSPDEEELEEPEGPTEDDPQEARTVTAWALEEWYNNADEGAVARPTAQKLARVVEEQGFNASVALRAAEDIIASSVHRILAITSKDFRPPADAVKITHFDPNYWYDEFRQITRTFLKHLEEDDDEPLTWFILSPNEVEAERMGALLNSDPEVFYWEVDYIRSP